MSVACDATQFLWTEQDFDFTGKVASRRVKQALLHIGMRISIG